jgi:hypothetical protein
MNVEYRLIRPGGTLLWAAAVEGTLGEPAVSPWVSELPRRLEKQVRRPWRYEAREARGEWVLLAEKFSREGQVAPVLRWRIRHLFRMERDR